MPIFRKIITEELLSGKLMYVTSIAVIVTIKFF